MIAPLKTVLFMQLNPAANMVGGVTFSADFDVLLQTS